MLRKSSTVGLLLLLIGILSIHVQAAAPNTIPHFLDEYYEAVKEGDLSLSHNLLRYNEERLENYMQENHPDHLSEFKEIKKHALGAQRDIDSLLYEHLGLVLWLDALVNKEPRLIVKEKEKLLENIEQYHNQIGIDNTTSLEDIKSFWGSVLPAAALTFDEAFFQQFNHHYNLLSQADEAEEIDRILSLSIEMMQKEPGGGMSLDALVWTIIIVGGCIILTLLYVGYRKYQAEKKAVKERLYKRNSNS